MFKNDSDRKCFPYASVQKLILVQTKGKKGLRHNGFERGQ